VPDRPSHAGAGAWLDLVDTHCHLDARQFAGEPVEAILGRARQADVRRVVTIGTELATSRAAVELAASHAGVSAAVGVDPNDAAGFGASSLAELRELAAEPGVVAIGEIGLDYYWDRVPRDEQRRAFEAQLALADELELPVVIHSRDAGADTESILMDWARTAAGRRPLGVLHCFSGTPESAGRLAEAGFLVSFAGNVTYKNATELQAAAAQLPLDAIVLETDAPYLAPVPHRGTRNEPARVRDVAAFVAELRRVTVQVVAAATTANAERLFRWNPV
jgi:TatD DNase family protein